MYDIMPFCFIYTFYIVDPWALCANRSVRRHHTFVTQTTCFLNSPCWRTNWKNTSTKCRWLDLGARMLFKQQMPGLKKGWNHDVLPGIWSGGFQFHLRDLVIRLLVVDRRTCWLHAGLLKFYLKFWQIDPFFLLVVDRFSMSGLMRLSDMFLLLLATHLSGRSGGRILKM